MFVLGVLTDKIKIRGTFLSLSEPLNVTTEYQIKSDTEILRDELVNIFLGCDKFSKNDKIVIKKVYIFLFFYFFIFHFIY